MAKASQKTAKLDTPAPVALPNIHPADELAAVREEITQLQERADELRAQLLVEGADLKGDSHLASVLDQKRETLDRKALTETFGEAAIAPFLKTTSYKVVKLTEIKTK